MKSLVVLSIFTLLTLSSLCFADGSTPATPAPSPTAWSCRSLMHIYKNQILAQAISNFSTTEADVIAGAVTPGWKDFDALTTLLPVYTSHSLNLNNTYQGQQIEVEAGLLAKMLKKNKFDLNFTRIPFAGTDYLPGEYVLKQAYRNLLIQFNTLLPPDQQLVLTALPLPAVTTAQDIAQAKAVVKQQAVRITQSLPMLDPTLTTWEEFNRRNEAWLATLPADSIIHRIYETLKNPKLLKFTMRRPENARFWLPMTGFLNQRETHSSRGNPNTNFRNRFEARALGIPEDEYVLLRDALKPDYGYLRFDPKSGLYVVDNASQYGNDLYTFDYEKIKKIVMFTIGDSLGNVEPINQLTFGRSFTPIEYLKYSISAWMDEAKKSGDLDMVTPGSMLQAFLNHTSLNSIYCELQYMGPLTLDMVTEYTFTTYPPDALFLNELLARGIKIFDGRADLSHPIPYKIPIMHQVLTSADQVKLPHLKMPAMVAPADVKPFSISPQKLMALFPDATKADFTTWGNNTLVQTAAMKSQNLSYLILTTEASWDGSVSAGAYPISTDSHHINMNLQTVYSFDGPIQKKSSVADSFSSISQEWNALYHLSSDPAELALLNANTPGRTFANSISWQNSVLAELREHGKVPNLIRNTLKGQCPFVRLNPIQPMNVAAATNDIIFEVYASQGALDQFKSNGQLIDATTGDEFFGARSGFLPRLQATLSPKVLANAATYPGQIYYLGMELINNLNQQVAFLRSLPVTPDLTAQITALQARSAHASAEYQIASAIAQKQAVASIQTLLTAMPAGAYEYDAYDTEPFLTVIQDYIAGKF